MSKPPVRFRRANFLVHALDRALRLYRDILGFEVVINTLPAS